MLNFFKRKLSLKEKYELLESKNKDLAAALEQATEHSLELDLQINIRDAQIAELNEQAKQLNDQMDERVRKTEAKMLRRIYELGEMSLEVLRTQPCKFDVYSGFDRDEFEFDFDDESDEAAECSSDEDASENAEPVKWAVVTGRCQYGGCDLPTWFDDERSARIYAILRTECGFQEVMGICGSCQYEYNRQMYDCI